MANAATTATTASPFGAFGGAAGAEIDVETGLQDGTLSTAEAIAQLCRQVARQEQATAVLEARLGGGGAPLAEALVRKVLGHQTEAPTNQHQVAVFCAAADDPALAQLAPRMLMWSALLIVFQTLAAFGVFVGTFRPACASSDQCFAGSCCNIDEGRCDFCGGAFTPLTLETEGACAVSAVTRKTAESDACTTHNWPDDPNFAGYNATAVRMTCVDPTDGLNVKGHFVSSASVRSWCDACVSGTTFDVNPLTSGRKTMANVAAMGFADKNALAVAAYIVALNMVLELKDVELVDIAVAKAGAKIGPNMRRCFTLLSAVRRWVFLPALLMTVPWLVMFSGGDALSVCFNTVAVLFLLEVDNISFHAALPEQLRSRVEEHGHVVLSGAQATALVRTKPVHIAMIMVAVLGAVAFGGATGKFKEAGIISAFTAFFLGRAAESFGGGRNAAEVAKGVAMTAGAVMLGFGVWVVLLLSHVG